MTSVPSSTSAEARPAPAGDDGAQPLDRPWRTGARGLPYLPGLDAVRALAVVAVLLFHLPERYLPGGFLGVDLFFVLSGFLITSLLLEEMERTRRVAFKEFYVRRARRLLPALVAMLVLTGAVVLWLAPDAAAQFRKDAVAALTYTTNWWYVVDARSYFEMMGRPPMLQHLWSLAVEEQFYFVWPVVAWFAWRRWGIRGVGIVALVGALVSTVLMTAWSVATGVPGTTDAARVYFGSDTHAMTIMTGAVLATVYRPTRLPLRLPRRGQLTLVMAGVASILALLGFFLFADESSAWLYRGGFLLMAVCALPLLAATAHPASAFGQALGQPVLRWLGTRSYGIYLYHWPIFLVTRPDLDLPYGGLAATATSLGLTFGVAELSYRYLEMPIRRGALGRAWRSVREGSSTVRAAYGLGASAAVVTLLAGGGALIALKPLDANDYLGGVTSLGAGELTPRATPTGTPGGPSRGNGTGKSGVPGPGRPIDLRTQRITAVGDSVLLGARGAIKDTMPRTTIDATISRQPYELIDRVEERERLGLLAPVLVIHTGTNGIPIASDLRALLVSLQDERRIVLVNVHAPVPWAEQSNKAISIAAKGLPNVVVADWDDTSSGQRAYFYPDGTHLTPRGQVAFARMIAQAIEEHVAEPSPSSGTGSSDPSTSPSPSPSPSATD
jgi:peptidoglycan/LPS O-acetylase OafA/YrhL